MTSPLIDPYTNLDEADVSRIQADVSTADKNLIKAIHPDRGILQLAVNNLIYAIANDIRKLGIKHYSPENSDKVESIVRRRSLDGLVTEEHVGDDGGRSTKVRSKSTNSSRK